MTQSIDIHADFDISEKSPQQHATSRPITIVVSLLVHGLVFFLLFYFSGFTSKPLDHKQPDISAIKATLYFPPPPAPVVKPEPVPESVQETQAEIAAEQIETPVPDTPLPREPDATESQATEPEPLQSEIVAPNTELPATETPPPEDQPQQPPGSTAEQSSAARMERLNRTLSSHLNSLHENQVNQMSQDASRNWQQDYYQRQTSGYKPPPEQPGANPDGPDVAFTEGMLETGIEMSAGHQSRFKAKEVDCSNTASEVLTSLSGLFGGRIKCNDNSDFQKYIDARLKKK